MNNYRALSETETAIYQRQQERLKEELEHHDYLDEHTKLMLDKGLLQNYKQQVKEWQKKRDLVLKEKGQIKFALDDVEDKLKNGVPIKEEGSETEAQVVPEEDLEEEED